MPDAASRTFIMIGCCLVLGACGQRGPLYLPPPQTGAAAASSAIPSTISPGATATDARGEADEKKPAPSKTPQP